MCIRDRCGTAYNVLSFRILKAGGMTLYSVFLMLGGMLLPYVYGVLFLDEPLTALRIVGVAVIGVAVVLSCRGTYKVSPWVYALCAVVFLLNGGVSIFSKIHQIEATQPVISTTAFVMYGGVGRFIFSSGALLAQGKKAEKPKASFLSLIHI